MEGLLEGLVPGLPRRRFVPDPRARRRACRCTPWRPCGCSSTAAPFQEGAVYRPTGPIEALEVPETLHALIAARLDGLTRRSARRRRTPPCSGRRSRSWRSLRSAGIAGARARAVPRGRSSARRSSTLQADPRSPERGQYGFLEDLLKRVAYETLSKKERRAGTWRAAYLERSLAADARARRGPRVALPAGVRCRPDADDAGEIRD